MMSNSRATSASDDERHFDEPPSLNASLEAFSPDVRERSPFFSIASTHSRPRTGSISSDREVDSEADPDTEAESVGPWNPPAWAKKSSGWYRRSAELSPQFDSVLAARIPLPASQRQTPRSSPARDELPQAEKDREVIPKIEELETLKEEQEPEAGHANAEESSTPGYFRFAMRAEVQHRTEPVEAALAWLRKKIDTVTGSRTSLSLFSIILFLSWLIARTALNPPEPSGMPDLVTVASLSKSYEPLIYYTENGRVQIGDLEETSIAVWDLGESLRSTNMTSGPIIVQQLDDLSENLKTLAVQLGKFFVHVNGDVDSILITMEWAKRELGEVSKRPAGRLDNLHSFLSRVGILEGSNGSPTKAGMVITEVFGQSQPQRTKATIQRAFNEFLNVMEENINSELGYCTQIFGLFESIDRQFLNLQRAVIREKDKQEREEGEMLASLWTRVIGANASRLQKFQKNKDLLSSVKNRTLKNKHLLVEYNGKLLQLKANLEILRRRLVSPLVRSNDSSTMSVESQIEGLDGTYQYLKKIRESQRQRQLELIYGAERRATIAHGGSSEIEGY